MNDSNLEKGAATRFKPGVSGNPGGRPRTRPISQRYGELVEKKLPEEDRIKCGLPEGATYGDAVALAVAKDALQANRQPSARYAKPSKARPGRDRKTLQSVLSL